jgi:toxin ParE1/3/4
VNVFYGQAARADAVRQFRYYLVDSNVPDVAFRFRDALRLTIESLRLHPFVGPRYVSGNPKINNLRSWPVAGFEAIRIYYSVEMDSMHVIRILHGKRDVQNILKTK